MATDPPSHGIANSDAVWRPARASDDQKRLEQGVRHFVESFFATVLRDTNKEAANEDLRVRLVRALQEAYLEYAEPDTKFAFDNSRVVIDVKKKGALWDQAVTLYRGAAERDQHRALKASVPMVCFMRYKGRHAGERPQFQLWVRDKAATGTGSRLPPSFVLDLPLQSAEQTADLSEPENDALPPKRRRPSAAAAAPMADGQARSKPLEAPTTASEEKAAQKAASDEPPSEPKSKQGADEKPSDDRSKAKAPVLQSPLLVYSRVDVTTSDLGERLLGYLVAAALLQLVGLALLDDVYFNLAEILGRLFDIGPLVVR